MDLMNSASQQPANVPQKHASASSSKASKDRPAAPARDLASSQLECSLFRFLTLIILYPHGDVTLYNKRYNNFIGYIRYIVQSCLIYTHRPTFGFLAWPGPVGSSSSLFQRCELASSSDEKSLDKQELKGEKVKKEAKFDKREEDKAPKRPRKTKAEKEEKVEKHEESEEEDEPTKKKPAAKNKKYDDLATTFMAGVDDDDDDNDDDEGGAPVTKEKRKREKKDKTEKKTKSSKKAIIFWFP